MPHLPPICRALRQAVRDAGITQTALAAMLIEKQQTVSAWMKGREPKLDDLARIERTLNLPSGHLLRTAGYVEERTTVREAILTDTALAPGFRDVVLVTYDAGVDQSTKERQRSSGPRVTSAHPQE